MHLLTTRQDKEKGVVEILVNLDHVVVAGPLDTAGKQTWVRTVESEKSLYLHVAFRTFLSYFQVADQRPDPARR